MVPSPITFFFEINTKERRELAVIDPSVFRNSHQPRICDRIQNCNKLNQNLDVTTHQKAKASPTYKTTRLP